MSLTLVSRTPVVPVGRPGPVEDHPDLLVIPKKNEVTGRWDGAINVKAPNGQFVPVFTPRPGEYFKLEGQKKPDIIDDDRYEVVTPENPIQSQINDIAFRAADIWRKNSEGVFYRSMDEYFDYSRYGFTLIGKVWVDLSDRSTVEQAQKRLLQEKKHPPASYGGFNWMVWVIVLVGFIAIYFFPNRCPCPPQ